MTMFRIIKVKLWSDFTKFEEIEEVNDPLAEVLPDLTPTVINVIIKLTTHNPKDNVEHVKKTIVLLKFYHVTQFVKGICVRLLYLNLGDHIINMKTLKLFSKIQKSSIGR